jgi:hypothetical protein
VVSIGASGANAKVADATGKAVFTGLTPGAVDVHIFSADGYSATSYMGFNAASITDTNTTQSSVIDIYVQVINPNNTLGSFQTYYLTTATNTYTGYDFLGTGNVSLNLWDIAPGTTVSGTLYVAQGLATSLAGNSAFGASEKVNLGVISLATRATSGAVQQSFVANFAATPPAAPTLVTLQSVTPPAGMTMAAAGFGNVYVSMATVGAGLTLPDTIASVPLGDASYYVFASSATASWTKFGKFTVGGTLSVAASLTTAPTMAAGQAGAMLSWTNGTATPLVVVNVYDAGFRHDWTIFAAGSTTSVTLPTVPSIATAPLAVGTAYSVDMNNYKEFSGASYEQIISFFNNGGNGDLEVIGVTGVPYTR